MGRVKDVIIAVEADNYFNALEWAVYRGIDIEQARHDLQSFVMQGKVEPKQNGYYRFVGSLPDKYNKLLIG